MNFIKKQAVGAFITCATIVVTLIAMIIYGVILAKGDGQYVASASELFLIKAEFGTVTVAGVLALVFLVVGLVASQVKLEGIAGTVCEVVANAFRFVAPALIIFTFVFFLNGTLTGLGWTFFSNEELEIYPEAIALGKATIVTLVLFFVAAVSGMVASFFPVTKQEA